MYDADASQFSQFNEQITMHYGGVSWYYKVDPASEPVVRTQ